MPNIVIEYSANIAGEADIPGLCQAIASSVISAGHGAFAVAAVRVRAYRADDYVIGDGDPSYAFVNITARLAKGRPEADRVRTFDAVWAAVKAHLDPVDRKWTLAISMDVEEFADRLAYKQNRIHEKLGTKPFAKVMSS
jgi:5-carboxymethyl-2-hydroxymuconate isomerase